MVSVTIPTASRGLARAPTDLGWVSTEVHTESYMLITVPRHIVSDMLSSSWFLVLNLYISILCSAIHGPLLCCGRNPLLGKRTA